MPLSDTRVLAPGVRTIEVWAWAMYDFANSSYTTVVITALFNAYFVGVVAEGKAWGTLAWTVALGLSYALVMITGPLLGAYADARAAKKRVLLATTAGCVLFTAALSLVGRGDLAFGMVLIVLSNYCFGSGENIIAAFLPELATETGMGKLSGWGWSLGYLGGLMSLVASLAYLYWADQQGIGSDAAVPATMLITAAIFAAASLPTFLLLKERAQPLGGAPDWYAATFGRLATTLHQARRYQDLWRFLICIVFYQAGIQAVVSLAAIYAQVAMGFTTKETLLLLVVTNITAAIGAFAFGQAQDRLGHVATLAVTLVGWCAVVIIAWLARGPLLFWIAANLVGLCLGSSQSAARALVGYLSPPRHAGEFFGLWGLAVKLSSILGPMTYGLVTWISNGDHRMAMLLTGSFFIAGLLLLRGVNAQRGRAAAIATH
ncbi:MFS transporter [Methylotetracoccus oryzae]|uniref:MFS transporter n=1 Tax=Methylotetracoccus oryzae TaxID=1919059 RepID=UPI0019134D8E|nr:MFS transporter [Methylotetracoccus oryzae]